MFFQDINAQNHKLENLLLSMELAQAGLAKEGDSSCRSRVGGSAPASVAGESPGGIPKPALGGRGSCSCDGSPARSLTRSSTYTKLSEQAADRNGNGPDFPCLSADGTQDSGFVCCGESVAPSRADLLLEAAFLSEETASLLSSYAQTFSHSLPRSFPRSPAHSAPHAMPHSATYERLAPFRCGLGGGVGCMSHPCLSHHHLYLHPLREAGIQTESCPVPETAADPNELDTIAEQRTFRSQACSPTSTWMSDEGEELDSITTTTTSVTTATVKSTATEPLPFSQTPFAPPLPRSATVACSMESPRCEGADDTELTEDRRDVVGVQGVESADAQRDRPSAELSPEPHTSQPKRSSVHQEVSGAVVVEVHDSEDDEETEQRVDADEEGAPRAGHVQKSYWSRHFLVDLLAVAIPVVPTLAWLCRGPVRGGQPVYHIGSLLRGCCTVALHSLRRGGGLRHYPAGGGGMGTSQI